MPIIIIIYVGLGLHRHVITNKKANSLLFLWTFSLYTIFLLFIIAMKINIIEFFADNVTGITWSSLDVSDRDDNVTQNSSDVSLPSPAPSRSSPFPEVDLIRYWGVPVAALFGFLLNCVSFALMRRSKIRSSVMSLYFTVLAAVDIVFLVTTFLMQSHVTITGYDILTAHRVSCKVISFLRNAGYAISSWIVAAVAVERCLVVLFPLKAMIFSNKTKSKITMAVIVVVVGLLSCHPLIVMEVKVKKFIKNCIPAPQYAWFTKNIKNHLIAVTISYIPFFVLSLCNVLLVSKMMVAKVRQKSLTSTHTGYNLSRFTFTAIMVCLGFCFCTVPNMIILVVSAKSGWRAEPTLGKRVAKNIIPFMAVIRASVNFFVYICTSETFREELAVMICGGRCSLSLHLHLENARAGSSRSSLRIGLR